MSFDLDESENGQTQTEEQGETAGGEEGGSSSDQFIEGLAAQTGPDSGAARQQAPRQKEAVEEIYAIQRIYALRLNRFEIAPSIGLTLNDQYVSHPAIGVAVNYWWTNVLAVGLNFLWYQGPDTYSFFNKESDLNFFTRRSTRLAVPINEYQLGANLNFTYVPLYGKFAFFNKYIFQWDAYVVGGLGLMRTRPIAVVDPNVRHFDFGNRLGFNVGIGVRVFITRWLAIFGELRDYIFLEKVENREVSLTDRENPKTWLDNGSSVTNNVTAQIGFTLFVPFSFDYRLPK